MDPGRGKKGEWVIGVFFFKSHLSHFYKIFGLGQTVDVVGLGESG